MTVPLTIWSVRKVIESQPCSRAISPPLRTAIITANSCAVSSGSAVPRRKNRVVKPKQAAKSIMPSMAILTMPARSHQIPAIAPMASGVARRRLSAMIVVRLVWLPAAAAMMTVGINSRPQTVIVARPMRRHADFGLSARLSVPLKTNRMPITVRYPAVGTSIAPIEGTSPADVVSRVKVVIRSPSIACAWVKMKSPKMMKAMAMTRSRVSLNARPAVAFVLTAIVMA